MRLPHLAIACFVGASACSLPDFPPGVNVSYGIWFDGVWVSPGCGDANCNIPSPHFPLADTNQRSCYDNSGPSACPLAGQTLYGQDAQYGWDTVHAPTERFLRQMPDSSSYTQPIVQDYATGLLWQGCAAGITGPECSTGGAVGYTWLDALLYCDQLNWDGMKGWHLPDPFELDTIVDLGTFYPSIDTLFFPGTPSVGFWSSSSSAGGGAIQVYFDHGSIQTEYSKTAPALVRCVHDQPPLQPARFTRDASSNEPVVLDNITGLLWQGCVRGMSGSVCDSGLPGGQYSWSDALAYCEGLYWAGYSDWRLPNRKELRSIVNERSYSSSVDATAFPGTPSYFFWTSSSYAADSNAVWMTQDVSTVVAGQDDTVKMGKSVRCVRNRS
jgi:hypothetical protein